MIVHFLKFSDIAWECRVSDVAIDETLDVRAEFRERVRSSQGFGSAGHLKGKGRRVYMVLRDHCLVINPGRK